MKSTISTRFAVIAIALSGLIFACNKSSNNSGSSTADASNVSTSADDQTMVSNESDNLSNDATLALSSSNGTNVNVIRSSGGIRPNSVKPIARIDGVGNENDSLICDASVVIDTVDNPRTITITYNGTNCWGNRTRTGTVVLSIPQGTYWSNAGATVTMSIQNLVITRLIDGKSITINGTKSMTNLSGGNMVDLPNLSSITHTITDSISVLFSDSATRVWQTAKQRVFTYNNGIVITTTGTKTIGNYTNVAEWGTNRFGIGFISVISQAKVIEQSCDFRLTGGQNIIYWGNNITATITYGLDASGNAASCPGAGTYYLEVVWSLPNLRTIPIILPY